MSETRPSNELLFTHRRFTFHSRIRSVPPIPRRLATDINYLFLRQQVERSLAASCDNAAAREGHEGLARQYELEIERMSGGRIIFPSLRDAAFSTRRSQSASS